MKDQILDFMERDDFKPMKAEDLIAAMKIKDEDLEEFFADLRQLEEDGLIIMNRKKPLWPLPPHEPSGWSYGRQPQRIRVFRFRSTAPCRHLHPL